MKVSYHPETDSLYIDLSGAPGADAREVAPGVVLDFDADGRVVGIDLDGAAAAIDLSRLDAEGLPLRKLAVRESRAGVDGGDAS